MPEQGSPAAPSVYDEIREERGRQDQRWGGDSHDDDHDPTTWCDITHTYLRQANMEARGRTTGPEGYRGRMLQVAALAVAAIQSYDRREANHRIGQEILRKTRERQDHPEDRAQEAAI